MNVFKHPSFLKFTMLFICPLLSVLVWFMPWHSSVDRFSYDYLLNHSELEDILPCATVVIGIDDESLSRFPDPLILWHKYYAAIIDAATAGQAKAIGLDVIPSISLDTVSPEYDQILVKAIRNSHKKGTDTILGFSAGKNGAIPHRKFLLSASGMGFVNLTPDPDNIIRRQTLLIKSPRKNLSKSFSFVLAEHVLPKVIDNTNIPQRIYIDYRTQPHEVVSFAHVYDLIEAGDVGSLQKIFKDKVALLGVTSVKLPDIHPTPMQSIGDPKDKIYGVVIHAASIETIRNNIFFNSLSRKNSIILLLLLSLFSTLIALTLPPLRTITILSLLMAIGFVTIWFSFQKFIIIPLSPLLAGVLVGAVAGSFFKQTLEYWQFHRLQRYFKSYIHPEVMQEIIDNPSQVNFEGKKVTATIMFTDIRSFTTLSEKLSPEDVVSGLNQYFTEMTMAIIAENGYLNRYLGDGILAIFGAPNVLPYQGALAAIKSGFNMLLRLEALNKIKPFPGVDEIKIGIGLHTGEAIVGNIGCDEKMDYSIIGDAVNLSARIESQTKNFDTSMLVTEATYKLVKDLVEAKLVTITKVKGREQEVKLYEIIRITE